MPYQVRGLDGAEEIPAHQIAAVIGTAETPHLAICERDRLELRPQLLSDLASCRLGQQQRSGRECDDRNAEDNEPRPLECIREAARVGLA